MRIATLILVLGFMMGACGDDGNVYFDGGSDAGADTGADGGADGGLLDSGLDAELDGGPDAGPPMVAVRVVASGDAFPHADALGGQTARTTVAGVRSLALYRSMDDTDPLILFSATGPDVAVGYVPGDETVLTTIAASSIVPGTYTFGRLVQTYVQYEVDATLHRLDGNHEGVITAFQVIGDGTEVGGVEYDSGHYDLAFAAPGVSQEWSGEDGAFPIYSATAGAVGAVEGGEWAVYFPIDLVITAAPSVDSTLTLDVNMHESFRWTDLLVLGYQPDVFDVTDISFEPIVRFGGNSFALTLR